MTKPQRPAWQTMLATVLALASFAANSLLCRAALGASAIDAGSFTLVRIASGAIVLAVVVELRRNHKGPRFAGSWISGAALFGYAIAFSLAYHHLSAGVGALILFGSVQVTMIGVGIARGERPHWLEWLGLMTALGGLAYLVLRVDQSVTWLGAALMAGAGIAWGIYSLRGRSATDPIAATAGNFVAAAPLAIVAWLVMLPWFHVSSLGLLLAVISGALTSGLGYVIWYLALPGLTAMRAALVQLSVPILTALAATVLLHEPLTTRLLVGAALVLGGIAVALFGRLRRR